MQWPVNVQQWRLPSAQTISTVLLLIVVVILNVFTLYVAANNKTNIWQLSVASKQSTVQLKQVDADLKIITQQLQKNTSLSEHSTKQIIAELTELQSAIEKLPSQQDMTQMQNTLTQVHQQLLQASTAETKNTSHHPVSHNKHHKHPHRLSPKALPFNVVGIDIWNGTTQATVTCDGAPQLLAKGDNFLGWTLVTMSFDLEMAVFKNARGQQVIVHIA